MSVEATKAWITDLHQRFQFSTVESLCSVLLKQNVSFSLLYLNTDIEVPHSRIVIFAIKGIPDRRPLRIDQTKEGKLEASMFAGFGELEKFYL